MQITQLDHLVLTVKDIEITIEFYSRVLGMSVVEFGEGRRALTFGDQKINLHQSGREFQPHAQCPLSGSADLCFIIDVEMQTAIDHLNRQQVEILEGPVARTGANGPIQSLYIRDPDLNLIELSVYL